MNGDDQERNREIEAALAGSKAVAQALRDAGFDLLAVGVAIVYRDGTGKRRGHGLLPPDDGQPEDTDTAVALGRSVGELGEDAAALIERLGPTA